MAATPKRKHSTARQGKRRAAIVLKKPKLISCPKCKKLKRSHFTCQNC